MIKRPPFAAAILSIAIASPALAADGDMNASDPRVWLLILAGMALAPFLLTMVTSFVKLVIVGSLIRTALGTQQVPPTQVITGLALILTIHVMWPVGSKVIANYQQLSAAAAATQPAAKPDRAATGDAAKQDEFFSKLRQTLDRAADAAREPIGGFLRRHSHPENVRMFESLQRDLLASQRTPTGSAPASASAGSAPPALAGIVHELTVLVPAFVLSELTEAFQIGFIIFIPFLIIDLVVSNLLLAMGMFMLSPTVIALPLKLLLFVLVDGWQLIIRGVIQGYVG